MEVRKRRSPVPALGPDCGRGGEGLVVDDALGEWFRPPHRVGTPVVPSGLRTRPRADTAEPRVEERLTPTPDTGGGQTGERREENTTRGAHLGHDAEGRVGPVRGDGLRRWTPTPWTRRDEGKRGKPKESETRRESDSGSGVRFQGQGPDSTRDPTPRNTVSGTWS